MRMRKKKNLGPRLDAVAGYVVTGPEKRAGQWRDVRESGAFERLWVELGCGMGRFAVQCAQKYPNVMLTAVERVPEALVAAAEKAKASGAENLRFIRGDAALIDTWFAAGEVDRLYIQFCDPWPKKKQAKRRLTCGRFLALYARILARDGELWFKSDNGGLVAFTRQELLDSGWELRHYTEDWHHDPSRPGDDMMTEYEVKFTGRGAAIGRIIASPRITM